MAKEKFHDLIQRLRTVLVSNKQDARSDAALLASYVDHRDQDAFTALVARHGQVVWGICVGFLHDSHHAEDVFQAAFLRLARNADSVRRGGNSVRGWLCRVASRTAMNLHRSNIRQAKLKQKLSQVSPPEAAEYVPDNSKVWDVVVEELAQLPNRYREPLEQCLLRGQSSREAASELGCSHTAVQRRMERGQHLLRERLQGRGIVLTAGSTMLTAFAIGSSAAEAAPSFDLMARTAESAASYGAGQAVSGSAAALVEGASFANKGKLLLLASILLIGTVGSVVWVMMPGQSGHPQAAAFDPAPPHAEKVSSNDAASKQEAADGLVRVVGQVVDADGKRVPNAAIAICALKPFTSAERGQRHEVLSRTKADDQGLFAAEARHFGTAWDWQERIVQVFVAAPGQAPVAVSTGSLTGAITVSGQRPVSDAFAEFRLLRPEVIRGVVRDAGGKPIAGASVSVRQIGGVVFDPSPQLPRLEAPPLWPKSVVTDEKGSFELEGLNLTQGVTVQVDEERYAPKLVKLNEQPLSGKSGAIVLTSPGFLEGRVIAADTKKPLPACRIIVQPVDARGEAIDNSHIDVVGDESGKFRVRLDRAGNYRVFAAGTDVAPYLSVNKPLAFPADKNRQVFEFELPRGVEIRGRVLDRDSGKPVPRVRVQFLADRGKAAELPSGLSAGVCGLSITGDDGVFRLVVPDCRGHLVLHEPSGDFVREEASLPDDNRFLSNRICATRVLPIDSPSLSADREIRVEIHRGIPATVKILDPEGKPVDSGMWLSQNWTAPAYLFHGVPQPLWDPRFALRGCESGRIYPVLILDAERKLGALIDMRADASAELAEVKLQQRGQATLHLRNEAGEPVTDFSPSLIMMIPSTRAARPEDKQSSSRASGTNQTNAVDPLYDWKKMPPSDKDGIVALPLLIPGVRYRIHGFFREGKPVEFEVSAGQTLKLPDMTIIRPR